MKKLFVAALAVLALASCQKQSELNFEDIAGKGTITGKVLYKVGYVINDNEYQNQNLPAVGVEVVAEVAYSEYSDGATGTKKFVATTNDKGEFSLAIPVGQQPVQATVFVRGFRAANTATLGHDGQALPNEAYYELPAESRPVVSVSNGEVSVLKELVMTATPDEIRTRNTAITVGGNIYGQEEVSTEAEKWEFDGEEKFERGNEAAIQCELNITFKYQEEEITYKNLKTASNGSYSFTANLYDTWDLEQTTVTVKTVPFIVDDFKHKYFIIEEDSWKTQPISGIYDAVSETSNLSNSLLFEGVYREVNIYLTFAPLNRDEVKGIGRDVDYDDEDGLLYEYSNPFNW